MKNKLLVSSLITVVLLVMLFSSANAAGYADGWKNAYKNFISTGEYKKYLRVENPEFSGIFDKRDMEWDSFAVYDLDLDGVPELLIRSDYMIEQIDIFAYRDGSMRWIGTMGGDNFFQTIITYDGAGIKGRLYTLSGGAMMEIEEYRLFNGGLVKLPVGCTQVDSESEETIGIHMYVSDKNLEQLLRGTLSISGKDQGERIRWFSRNRLSSESEWNDLLSTLRENGSWY